MNLFLDDERFLPDDGREWTIARTAWECIQYLKDNKVEHLSLDHDLGDENEVGNGYDVVEWLEYEAALKWAQHIPPSIVVHSENCSKAPIMRAGIESIKRLVAKRKI